MWRLDHPFDGSVAGGGVMLSDQERQTLDDMERELLADDPRLVRLFRRAAQTLPVPYGWSLAVILGLSLLLGAITLLMGAFGQAAAFGVLAGEAAMVRHYLRPTNRVTGSSDA
jgi:hypothetical protein